MFEQGNLFDMVVVDAEFPAWFRRRSRPEQVKNVLLGLHPFGRALLGVGGWRCGHCAYLVGTTNSSRKYWKCRMSEMSHTARTDVDRGWLACDLFVDLETGERPLVGCLNDY